MRNTSVQDSAMFGGKNSQFDRSLEKATSQLLLEPDWDSMLQICDCIRQGDVQPKYAMAQIKRKISSDNPHVAMFSLQVMESCMKNCGVLIHQELATKEIMEFFKDQCKVRTDPVKAKILELIQVWSHAFRNEPNYRVVEDTFNLMKMEGFNFPTLKEADAMFNAEKAPEWKDGDNCMRCRVVFGLTQRKHHCRNCGEIFCSKCSGKFSIIPNFGIEKEVRVCDSCYEKIHPESAGKKKDDDQLPAEYLASPLSKQSQVAPSKTEQEIKEEEELQLALALSQSEHDTQSKEGKRTQKNRMKTNYSLYNNNDQRSGSPVRAPQVSAPVAPVLDTSDMDPELARYLNRNYWEQRSEDTKQVVSTTTPSAPSVNSEPKMTVTKVQEVYQNGETSDPDEEQFNNALQSSVEIFVNRMQSNSQRGRSIANDSSVQSLFSVISSMHPELMKHMQEQEDLRAHYESLQDKLAQLRDAREALDALREDHREKRRLEMEEQERQKQIQMAYKLDIMRQKKHEYLEMQRQRALQRLHEQEQEMQMRLEQQKHMTQVRQMQAYGYPQQQPVYQVGPGGMPAQQAPGMYNIAAGAATMPQQPGMQMNMAGGQQPGVASLPPQQQYGAAPGVPGAQMPYTGAPPNLQQYQGQLPPQNMGPGGGGPQSMGAPGQQNLGPVQQNIGGGATTGGYQDPSFGGAGGGPGGPGYNLGALPSGQAPTQLPMGQGEGMQASVQPGIAGPGGQPMGPSGAMQGPGGVQPVMGPAGQPMVQPQMGQGMYQPAQGATDYQQYNLQNVPQAQPQQPGPQQQYMGVPGQPQSEQYHNQMGHSQPPTQGVPTDANLLISFD